MEILNETEDDDDGGSDQSNEEEDGQRVHDKKDDCVHRRIVARRERDATGLLTEW
jgi:hypothetical protein